MKRHWLEISVAAVLVAGLMMVATGAEQTKQGKSRPKRKQGPSAMQPIEDVAGLPRVLLIGDSISIGYTLPVRELLEGKANVHRPRANCGPTTRGLEQIDAWLGDKKWDVIHFNWGLHDLKYMGPKGQNLADPQAADSHQQVPPDEYEANLRQLVTRLQQTGAKLIWCATTPVPPGASGRVVDDAVGYNDVAAKVMQEKNIPTNDLHAFAKARLTEIQRPANVHFTPEGSQQLAEQVARAILKQLDE
jgi:acyl-CoA thioesterase-1